MAKIKPFVGHTVLAPAEWCDALGLASWVRQIDVLVLAESRAHMADLLTARGDRFMAKQIKATGARSRVLPGNDWTAFMAAADPGPGVYIMPAHAGSRVLRVDEDGAFTVMGWLETGRAGALPEWVPARRDTTGQTRAD